MIKDKLLSQLNEDDFYAILVNIQYVVNGSLKGTSPINSIIITGNANHELIAEKIYNGLRKAYYSYDMESEGSIVTVHWRNWIPTDKYAKIVNPVQRTLVATWVENVNEVLEKEAKLKINTQSKLDKIMKFMNVENISNFLDKFPTSIFCPIFCPWLVKSKGWMIDSITLLTKYKFSESDIKFMEYVQGLEKAVKDIKITVYQDSNEDTNLIIQMPKGSHKSYILFSSHCHFND